MRLGRYRLNLSAADRPGRDSDPRRGQLPVDERQRVERVRAVAVVWGA
ncbi:MAG: hypothetical protein ACRD0K_00025 [Egibacteraceae bacterium]